MTQLSQQPTKKLKTPEQILRTKIARKKWQQSEKGKLSTTRTSAKYFSKPENKAKIKEYYEKHFSILENRQMACIRSKNYREQHSQSEEYKLKKNLRNKKYRESKKLKAQEDERSD